MVTHLFRRIQHIFLTQKLYSLITLASLTCSVTVALLIYAFVRHELSFDTFHPAADRIFRLETNFHRADKEGMDAHHAGLSEPLIQQIRKEVPGIRHSTRWAAEFSESIVRIGDLSFSDKLTYVDTGFFSMFNFTVVRGQTEQPFSDMHAVVITESTARKYFGTSDPLGQAVTVAAREAKTTYTVTAVIQDPPINSSLEFIMLVPMETFPSYAFYETQWGEQNYSFFLELSEKADKTALLQSLDAVVGSSHQFLGSSKDSIYLSATALEGIHHNTQIDWPLVTNPRNAQVLTGIVLIIVLMACGNFIALSLVSASRRRIEVGLKKIAGASRARLIGEFIAEAIAFVLVAVVASLLLVRIAMPYFSTIVRVELAFALDPTDVVFVVLLMIGLGVVAGSYPAVVLSAFNPSAILKSHAVMKTRFTLVSALVVLQAMLSLFLATSAHVMSRQIQFLNDKDLGFHHDQVIVLPMYNARYTEHDDGARVAARFKAAAANEPSLAGVSAASNSFFKGKSMMGVKMKFQENFSSRVYSIDPDFISTMGLKLRLGRNFSPDRATDSLAVIINQAMADKLGEDPIGTTFEWGMNGKAEVIGVIDDFYDRSLEFPAMPLFLTLGNGQLSASVLNIKVRAGQVAEALKRIEYIFKEVNPGKPFEPEFLSAMVQAQYQSYRMWTTLIRYATLFATLIACVGLFALTGVETSTRYREIGIRKVFGASGSQILVRISTRYIRLVLIASIIATVASYAVMAQWVQHFAYRITIGWLIYAEAVAAGVLLLLLATAYHCVAASRTNPAVVLRSDG